MGLILLAVGCGVVLNLCYRMALRDGLAVPLVPFARGVITLVIMSPWLLRNGPSALATRRPWLHLARGTTGSIAFALQVLALLWLPLADAVALVGSRPLWVLPLAALMLHERVRRDRMLAAGIGFLGVLIIARPDGELSLGTVAALVSALSSGSVLVLFRILASTEPPARVVTFYALFSVLFWAPVCYLFWQTPSWFAIGMLVVGTFFAVAGDLLTSAAARRCEVGLLAPIEYVQIPASALIAWALFAEQPGWSLVAGTALMLGATLYLIRRGR